MAAGAQAMSLSEWYGAKYLQGAKFDLPGYTLDLPLNALVHAVSGIRVWQEVIDVRGDAGRPVVLFHYTGHMAYMNITHTGNKASEIRASLITEGDHANAWYGQGAYATQRGPDMWCAEGEGDIIGRLLDNNYRRMFERDVGRMGYDAARAHYAGRVLYCIPLFVSARDAYDVARRCTPEMERSGHGPGRNINGQPLNEPGRPPRDCWVVRLTDSDQAIKAAGARLVDTLRTRWDNSSRLCGPDHLDTVHCASRLAYVLRDRSEVGEAVEVYRAVVSGYEKLMGPDSLDTVTAYGNLALAVKELGQLGEAEELYRKSLAGHEKLEGSAAHSTRIVKSNLACLLKATGGGLEAERLYKETFDADMEEFGEDHPSTLISANNLAGYLTDQKKFKQAEPLLRLAVKGLGATYGRVHPRTLIAVSNLAGTLRQMQRYEEAKGLYERALRGHEAALGPRHTSTLIDCSNLAGVLKDQGDLAGAEPYYRRAAEGFVASLGPSHGSTLVVMNNLGLLYSKLNKNRDAEVCYREALAGLEKLHGPSHPQTLNAAVNLAGVLAGNREFNLKERAEALELFRRCEDGFRKKLGPDDATVKDCVRCMRDLEVNIRHYEAMIKR